MSFHHRQPGDPPSQLGRGMLITGVLLFGLSVLLYITVTCIEIEVWFARIATCGFGDPNFWIDDPGLGFMSWLRPVLLAAGGVLTAVGLVRKTSST
ncbi:MAG: hypothetical protein J4G11_13245 [Acidimicrobiia bacterium]|nr:hypothetical protein [Acidimicrobiia bacterium]